jgi:hypothetical protein
MLMIYCYITCYLAKYQSKYLLWKTKRLCLRKGPSNYITWVILQSWQFHWKRNIEPCLIISNIVIFFLLKMQTNVCHQVWINVTIDVLIRMGHINVLVTLVTGFLQMERHAKVRSFYISYYMITNTIDEVFFIVFVHDDVWYSSVFSYYMFSIQTL